MSRALTKRNARLRLGDLLDDAGDRMVVIRIRWHAQTKRSMADAVSIDSGIERGFGVRDLRFMPGTRVVGWDFRAAADELMTIAQRIHAKGRRSRKPDRKERIFAAGDRTRRQALRLSRMASRAEHRSSH